MAQPVVLIEFRVEATSVTSQDRGDTQARQPRISHPLPVASGHRSAPISSQHRSSEPCGFDYEKAVSATYTGCPRNTPGSALGHC